MATAGAPVRPGRVPGRRWWRAQRQASSTATGWLVAGRRNVFGLLGRLFALLLGLGALVLGYAFGHQAGERKADEDATPEKLAAPARG